MISVTKHRTVAVVSVVTQLTDICVVVVTIHQGAAVIVNVVVFVALVVMVIQHIIAHTPLPLPVTTAVIAVVTINNEM